MICPRCSQRVGRRKRTKRTCGLCLRRFAFEPTEDPRGLHDVRVRKAAAWLGEDGTAYTLGQLAAVLVRPPSLRTAVVNGMRGPWKDVYRGWPAGLVDETTIEPRWPEGQAAVGVLCPDPAVAACLWANDVPRRIGGVVATEVSGLPGDVPVLVLHDGTEEGLALAGRVRASGRRAVDLGLPAGTWYLAAVRPSRLIGWLEIAARDQERWRAGAGRAAGIGFLAWPGGG